MATLQVDVDRLNNDVTALQTFVQQVKDYVAANSGTVDTSSLETALTNMESVLQSGVSVLTPVTTTAPPPPAPTPSAS